MALNDKVFPLRMSNELYARLQKQAQRSCMTVTAYLRIAFVSKVEQDESAERQEQMLAAPAKRRK